VKYFICCQLFALALCNLPVSCFSFICAPLLLFFGIYYSIFYLFYGLCVCDNRWRCLPFNKVFLGIGMTEFESRHNLLTISVGPEPSEGQTEAHVGCNGN